MIKQICKIKRIIMVRDQYNPFFKVRMEFYRIESHSWAVIIKWSRRFIIKSVKAF